MKRLLLVIITSLLINSWSNAEDDKDFQIEGIAIGDNLLDHFSLEHVNSFDKEYYPKSNKFYEQYIHWPERGSFNIYEGLTISLKPNSFKIYSISGGLMDFKNFDECLNLKDDIADDIMSNYMSKITYNGLDTKLFDYADNKSKKSQIQIRTLDNLTLFSVDCTDWSEKAEKKNNWTDSLRVSIYSKEYENFLRNEAYK